MPALLAAPDASITATGPVHGSPLSSFVGREAEVTDLLDECSRVRLLSLVGPGGSGKTRLAHAVRDGLAAAGAATRWVPLAQLDRPALLVSAVADALGVAETPGRPLWDSVVGALRGSGGWLVLDNCEHLVAECAALAGDLLRECPGLRVLTTSREPLAVAGEKTWWVDGLSVPDDRPAPTAADLAGSHAAQLFADRARLVVAGFAVTDDNAAQVARLCRRLDGMPLALELAAARLRVLPLPRIVEWLDDAVPLLATTARDVPPRQATLRATLDWSHDLLPAPERDLFARLSVFRGGFSLAGAVAVAGDDADTMDILQLLTRLADKSLLQARTDGAEERYRLLEVVRQYAADRLGDRAGSTSVRHAHAMLDLAEQAEDGLAGGNQPLWLGRLHRDRGNMRAALTWSRRHDPALGIRLAGALGRYWRLSGQYAEGRQWLDGAVRAAGEAAAPTARAKALAALGTLEFLQCEYASAATRLHQARDLYVAAGDDGGLALILQRLGSIEREQGRYADARRHHHDLLETCRRRADPAGTARAVKAMGFTAWLEGDYARAVELSGDALRRFRELGDDEGAVGALIDLAAAMHRRGDGDGARSLLHESLTLADRLGLQEATAWAKEQLGLIAAAGGEPAAAATLLCESLAVHHDLGDRWRTAAVLDALAGLGADARHRARLLAAAGRLREEVGTPLPPSDRAEHDQRVRAVRDALGPGELAGVTAQGRALSVEQAVTEALGAPVPAADGPASRPGPAVPAPAAVSPSRPGTRSHTPPAEVTVRALGRSGVAVAGRTLGPEDWTYAKPRELLYHLLTRPGATKAEIGLALWPEASRTELRNSFHTCLKHLRRALGDALPVRYVAGAYQFEARLPLRYDVDDFRTAAEAARHAGATPAAVDALRDAAAHYRGDFLADAAVGGWAEPHRERLRREFEGVLHTLGGLLAQQRRFGEAADVFSRLLTHDPLLEAAHRGMMRCYAAHGDRGRALRQYQDLARLLDTQLGATPAPQTTQLYARLRAAS